MQIGKYTVSIGRKNFTATVENKRRDATFRVRVSQVSIHLIHDTGSVTAFKFFRHRGQWHWSDSRLIGSKPRQYIYDEIGRMLFDHDMEKAIDFVDNIVKNSNL